MPPMTVELIRLLETLAANACPAAEVIHLDGWRLRAVDGVHRRANSVWPNENHGRTSLTEKLQAVEAFYTARRLPARYQMCPAALPPDLDAVLVQRGYVAEARTNVQIADAALVLERTRAQRCDTVRVSDQFNDEWYSAYYDSEAVSAKAARERRGILQRIIPPKGFAEVQHDGKPAALGMGVVEQGWVGIFAMTTRPEFRRRGAAKAVLHALAEWGQTQGARRMYLQVMEDNMPARALYAGMGFETLYTYYYRSVATPR
jgi:ribosomal protein S18 acetylase RimI-like enzyme